MVSRFRDELGPDMKVIGTGGLAELIAAETDVIQYLAPWLTLEGLRLVWEMNKDGWISLSRYVTGLRIQLGSYRDVASLRPYVSFMKMIGAQISMPQSVSFWVLWILIQTRRHLPPVQLFVPLPH